MGSLKREHYEGGNTKKLCGDRGMTDMFTTLTAVMVSQVKAYQILCLNGVCQFVLQLSSS